MWGARSLGSSPARHSRQVQAETEAGWKRENVRPDRRLLLMNELVLREFRVVRRLSADAVQLYSYRYVYGRLCSAVCCVCTAVVDLRTRHVVL
jgi:hypothetical protein